MVRSKTASIHVAVLVACALAPRAGAQSERSAPLVVLLPASPIAAAMSGAYATAREQGVLFHDPAQLALAPARGVGVGVTRFGSAGTGASVSAVGALGGAGGIGLGVQLLQYDGPFDPGPVPVRALGTRGPLAASSMAVTLGGATVVRDMRVGAALRYAGEARGGRRGGGASADLAVARDVGLRRRLTVALVAQNIGRGITLANERTPSPTRLSLAAGSHGIQAGPLDLGWEAMATVLRDRSFAPALGGEASFMWLDGYEVAARAGVRRADRVGTEPVRATGSIGAGITADRVSIDYAFSRETGTSVQTVGIRLR